MRSKSRNSMTKQYSSFLLFVVAISVWGKTIAGSASLKAPGRQIVSKLLDATVRIETAADRSSGVIISDLGHVLTVSHGVGATEDNILIVHSSGQYSARLLKHDADLDLALLQLIDPPALLPTVELAARTGNLLQPGKLLFATGCPAREANSAGPVVRMGSVKAVTQRYIRSNCALTAGDSGGPLVGTDGRVVGLNARIGSGRESNLHIPMGILHSFLFGISGLKIPTTNSVTSGQSNSPDRHVVEQWSERQVRILDSDNRLICMGCRIDGATIATKLSLIEATDHHVRIGEVNFEAALLCGSREHDIGVLKIPNHDFGSRHRNGLARPQVSEVQVGDFVYANSKTAGIVGRVQHTEPKAKSVVGCTLLVDGERGLLVEEVADNSAASDAKLVPGDRLMRFCSKPCQELDDIGNAIANLQPGDIVMFEGFRSTKSFEGLGRLRHRPEELLNRTEFLDGRSGPLSDRRTGFTQVIQHDVAVGPSEVGGPLVDSNGRLIGINIARRSRESVLAVPIDVVLKVIETSTATD